MSTVREEVDRKLELLDRYRALRQEEVLEDLRARAADERARGRFPWKGAFRSREEIEALYRQRRRWDRRVLFDLALLVAVCLTILLATPALLKVILPN